MNKKEQNTLKLELIHLLGLPICYVSRAANMICIGFGKLEKKEIHCQYSMGDVTKEKKAGQFALHLQTSFRLLCGDHIVLGNSDIYQPTAEDARMPDFDWENFNYDVAGKNHFDEVVDAEILPNLDDFVVKKVSCSQMGDLKITFENQFILEVFIDSSTSQECWRFFRPYEDEEHVVIAGTGMIDENDICM